MFRRIRNEVFFFLLTIASESTSVEITNSNVELSGA